MKIIVTHNSPDWDAITSVWLLKKFLPGWEEATVKFVPAGTRLVTSDNQKETIEQIGEDEVIHVDTGLGPLDHHQTADMNTCAASLVFDYVKDNIRESRRVDAIERIVTFVVDLDHFQEVFWPDAASDLYEFGMFGVLEGFKAQHPNDDSGYVVFGMILLDAMMHRMEERIWAEEELKKSIEFDTKFGKGLGIETINDEVIKLAQKKGYVVVVRKDPRKGYVRIKALPRDKRQEKPDKNIDLTLVCEQLSKMDPEATWFLHVSKKMLLNGTPKNPKMIPTTLTLQQIVEVVKNV